MHIFLQTWPRSMMKPNYAEWQAKIYIPCALWSSIEKKTGGGGDQLISDRFFIFSFTFTRARECVSEQASEQMSAVEGASKASSAEQAKE